MLPVGSFILRGPVMRTQAHPAGRRRGVPCRCGEPLQLSHPGGLSLVSCWQGQGQRYQRTIPGGSQPGLCLGSFVPAPAAGCDAARAPGTYRRRGLTLPVTVGPGSPGSTMPPGSDLRSLSDTSEQLKLKYFFSRKQNPPSGRSAGSACTSGTVCRPKGCA